MKKVNKYPNQESIVRHELPNGIVLLVYENVASATVEIEGTIRCGSLVDSPEQAGRSNFTAKMLTRGTEKRDFDTIYEIMESYALGISIGSGRHSSSFSAGGLAEDFSLILDMLYQSLRFPTFPEAEFSQLQGEILTGIQMRENSTEDMARLAFFAALYPNHPYGYSVQGYKESISALTREDLIDFHRLNYGPKGMIISIVGAVKATDVVAQVTAMFGDWYYDEQPVMPSLPELEMPKGITRIHVDMPDKSQADVLLGLPGPLRTVPDYFSANIANSALGVFGMMGRLGTTVREEQGLAYYVYSQLASSIGPYPWYVGTGVAPENVEQAIETILIEIKRIQTELLSEEELADNIAYRVGSLPVSLEANSGLANIIADLEFYQLGLDYLINYEDKMKEVTVESVREAAAKYFSSTDIYIVVAGPKQEEVVSD